MDGKNASIHTDRCDQETAFIQQSGNQPLGPEDASDDIIPRITTWNQGKKYPFLVEELPDPVFVGNCSVEKIDFEQQHASLDGGYAPAGQAGELLQQPGV